MPKVATFCPRCGESIETEVPEEAKAAGRAEITCPACQSMFQIAPTRASPGAATSAPPASTPIPQGAPAPAPWQGPTGTTGTTGGRQYGRVPSQRSMKPLIAAFLLLMAAVTWGWMGYELVTSDSTVADGLEVIGGNGTFAGHVRGPEGVAIGNVTVIVVSSPEGADLGEVSQRTDAAGAYSFEGLPAGPYVFEYRADGWGNHTRTVPVYPAQWNSLMASAGIGDITMPPEGEETEVDLVAQAEAGIRGLGYVFLGVAVVTGLGCYAAYKRRWFPLAVIGSITATIAIFVPPVALGGLGALILVILARKEFSGSK